jgi:hypothetical protein
LLNGKPGVAEATRQAVLTALDVLCAGPASGARFGGLVRGSSVLPRRESLLGHPGVWLWLIPYELERRTVQAGDRELLALREVHL